MKSPIQKFTLAAAGFSASASALLSMEVRYTDNMVDVGNLDAFAATWQTIYATSGNLQGVVTDNSYGTDQSTCQTDSQKDLTVQVTMDGAWGLVGDATASDIREAIVSTLWSSVEALWAQSQYTVYEDCSGTTWQESVLYSSSAACGPKSAVSCEDACSDAGTPYLVQCTTATYGSKLPSELRVTVYEDGTLLADDLTVTFAATANDISDGGCGLVGTISEQLSSFIPVVGGLFSAGISFECSQS